MPHGVDHQQNHLGFHMSDLAAAPAMEQQAQRVAIAALELAEQLPVERALA